jgi:DNA repair photolyase
VGEQPAASGRAALRATAGSQMAIGFRVQLYRMLASRWMQNLTANKNQNKNKRLEKKRCCARTRTRHVPKELYPSTNDHVLDTFQLNLLIRVQYLKE